MNSKLRTFFEYRVPLISYLFLFIAIFILYLVGFEITSLSTIKNQVGSLILMLGFIMRIIASLTTRYLGKIKITGLYAICRQPLLLSQMISYIGLNIIIANHFFLLVTIVVFFANDVFSAKKYDKILCHTYRDVWKIYAKNTNFLFPVHIRWKDVFKKNISSTEIDNSHNFLIFLCICIILIEISALSVI